MTSRAVHHFFMRIMVWNMRWMTRYVGFIARPIVQLYGANEIIACGLRDGNNNVVIIYTPGTGHQDHAVMLNRDGKWEAVAFTVIKNFSGSVVRCLEVSGALSGSLYRVKGTKTSGRRLSSPRITVKPTTTYDPALLDINLITDKGVTFSWKSAEKYDPMIYFLAVEDERGAQTYSAIYTRETSWLYPNIKSASYSVGPTNPPALNSRSRYIAKLVLVDYDGWVSHIAHKEFLPSSI